MNPPDYGRVENLTVEEFLAAGSLAATKGAYNAGYRHLLSVLENSPRAKERLALSLLDRTIEKLNRGESPRTFMSDSLVCSKAIRKEGLDAYLTKLEEIAVKCNELIGQSGARSSARTTWDFTLHFSMAACRKLDRSRFERLLGRIAPSLTETGLRRP